MFEASDLIALAAVALSGLTIWLTFQERRSSYRQAIYAKQIEAYVQVIEAANKLRFVAISFAYLLAHEPDYNNLLDESNELYVIHGLFVETNTKNIIFLPSVLEQKLAQFSSITAGDFAVGAVSNSNDANSYIADIRRVYKEIIDIAREHIGTDPLSAETLKLIGNVPNKPKRLPK